MVNTAEDSPVSYLNKGQVYQLTVEDTNPAKMDTGSNQYQTFVRISFDEEQQRSDPAISWQLWRAGRASNEYRESDEEHEWCDRCIRSGRAKPWDHLDD